MSQAINQEPIQWCYEARAHKNDNFASILVSEVLAEDDVTVAKIIKTQQFDWTMESHTQDVRGGEEPVYFEEDHILSTHCESLRKKNNSLLPKGGQGNSSTIASPDLGGIRWHYIFYYIYLRITPILSERTQVIVSLATRVEVGAVVLADRGQSC